jgi:hypothetical protein
MIMETGTVAELKGQLEELQKSRVRQARRCATMFGIISILALIGFVYGYVQHDEGRRMSERAEVEKQQAISARDEALRQVSEAELAMKELEQLTIELELCKASKK